MDISVSRLNNRMALQVPAELPLGLVFITGWVEKLFPAGSIELGQVEFELVDEQHRLACRVPQQVIDETQVEAGDRIRVSGHLVFEPRSAHYYLYARDLEVLPVSSPQPTKVPAPPITPQHRETASLAPGELPPWVEKLAPREIQEELGLQPKQEEDEEALAASSVQPLVDQQEKPFQLTPELLDFLSGAIDSNEDIELTREMIDDYLPGRAPESGQSGRELDPADVFESVPPSSAGDASYQESAPAGLEQQDMPEAEESALTRDSLTTTAASGRDVGIGNYRKLWALVFLLLLVFFLIFLLGLALWSIFVPGEVGLLIMVAV